MTTEEKGDENTVLDGQVLLSRTLIEYRLIKKEKHEGAAQRKLQVTKKVVWSEMPWNYEDILPQLRVRIITNR